MKLVAVAAPLAFAAILAGCGDETVTCPTGQTMCNNQCVNLDSNAANCGACGTTCKTGETCSAGKCGCGGTTTSCNGACVDFSKDAANCGSCGNACKSGEVCDSGVCKTGGCDAPKLTCDGACVDPQSDNANCGTCGTKCDTTKGFTCTAGKCGCISGMTDCAGSCVNTGSDINNCGACGTKCTAGQFCNGGKCQSGTCASPKLDCSGDCIDPQSDNNNCGTCGTKCDTAAGLSCVAGKCSCIGGYTACGTPAKCVDTNADANNCGTCGTKCATGEACQAGKCTPAGCGTGQSLCNGLCVDLNADPNNCGTCGVKCTGGKTCVAKVCQCPTGQTDCSGTCATLGTDVNNCGACGTKCATGQVCTGTPPTCQTVCPTGQKACSGACVTVATDPNNCTDCGIKCTGGKICNNGCVCPTGLNDCSGTCVDFKVDDKNCGSCGKACAATETCQNGACVAASFVQLQVNCGVNNLPVNGKTQCTANGVLQGGTTVPLTTDTKLTWNVVMDPTSPVGCAGLTVGSFSTTTKGEFQVANNPTLAALGCRALITATYVGTTQTITSNNVIITVRDKKITGVTITPNTPTVPALACLTLNFRIFVSYDSGETIPLTALAGGESVTWLNMNPAVATFAASGGGLLFANTTPLAAGAAEIRATAVLDGTTYNVNTNLTVVAATMTGLAIVPKAPAAIAAGNTVKFTAVATFNNSTQLDVTNFDNADPYVPYGGCADAVFTHLSGNHVCTGTDVPTAPCTGPALTQDATTKKYASVWTATTVPTGNDPADVIRASWNGWNDDAAVTVSGAVLVSCVIRHENTAIPNGTLPAAVTSLLNGTTWPKGLTKKKTYTFGRYSNGTWADITDGVAWTSDKPNIANVNNTAGAKGEIDMLLAGTAKISADPTALRPGVTVCTADITVATAQVCKLYVLPRYRNDSPNEYRRAFRGAGGGSDPHVGSVNGPGLSTFNGMRPVLPNENGFQQRFGATAFYCTTTSCPAVSWPGLPPTGGAIPANCYPVDVTTSATWSNETAFTAAPVPPAGLSYSGTPGIFNTVKNTGAGNWRREDVVTAEVPLAEGSPTMVTGSINALVCGEFVANTLKLYSLFPEVGTPVVTPANVPRGTDYRYLLVNPFRSTAGVCDFAVSPAIGGGVMTNGYLLNVGEEATAWATTPTGIATVNTATNAKGNLHADNIGTTSVTGTFFGNTTNLDFIVGDPIVKSCAITPTSGSLIYFPSYTDSLQFTVTATLTDNSTVSYTQNAATSFFKYVDATSGTLSGVGSWGTGVNKGRLYANTSVASPTNVYIGATIGSVRCTPCGSGDAACPTPVTARPIVTISPATVAEYFLQVANRGCFEPVVIPTVSVNTSIYLKACIKWSNGSIVEDGIENLVFPIYIDAGGPSLWTSPQPTILQFAGNPTHNANWARFDALAAGEPVTVTAQRTFAGPPAQTFNPTMTIPVSAAPITAVTMTGRSHKNVLPGSVCAQFGSQYEYCEWGGAGTRALVNYRVLGTRTGLPPQDLTFSTSFSSTLTGCTGNMEWCSEGGAGCNGNNLNPLRTKGVVYYDLSGPNCTGALHATVTFVDNTTMSTGTNDNTVYIFNENPAAGLAVTLTPSTLTGAGKNSFASSVGTSKVGNLFVPFDMSIWTNFTTDLPQTVWLNVGYAWVDTPFEHGHIISRAVSSATQVKIFGDYDNRGTQIGQAILTINP